MSLRRLGKYELERRLAVGGMGEVFLAKERGLAGFERRVVLKQLLPQLGADEIHKQLFIDEARIGGYLRHPGIVQVYEFGEVKGRYFLAMEYVDGVNLQRLLKDTSSRSQEIPLAIGLWIVASVADALHYAHLAKDTNGQPLHIVHRDISPSNILISRDGDVKLMDFGVAKARSSSHMTETGVVRGKIAYMAPEQIANKEVDARADVYALGAMLWELSVGLPLHYMRSDLEILRYVTSEAPPRPSEFEESYSPALEKIVLTAMERDLVLRTSSAGELASSIRQYLKDHGYAPTQADVAAWLKESAPAQAPQGELLADEERSIPSVFRWVGAISVGVLAIALVARWWGVERVQTPPIPFAAPADFAPQPSSPEIPTQTAKQEPPPFLAPASPVARPTVRKKSKYVATGGIAETKAPASPIAKPERGDDFLPVVP